MRDYEKCLNSLRFNETSYEFISFPHSYGVLMKLFIAREQWDLLDVWAGELYTVNIN